MHIVRTLVVSVAFGCAAPALGQSLNIKPGKYETTATMEMPGMKMAPQKNEECITAADLKDFSKKLVDPEMMQGCKISNYKIVGNKLTFDVSCKEDDLEMSGTTEMTFGPESFTNVVTMKDNKGRVTTIKGSAKRVGECARP
jgi:hypothetical protein